MRAAAGQFFLLNPHGRQSTLMSNDCSPTIWHPTISVESVESRPTIWRPTISVESVESRPTIWRPTYTTSVALAAWVCAFCRGFPALFGTHSVR